MSAKKAAAKKKAPASKKKLAKKAPEAPHKPASVKPSAHKPSAKRQGSQPRARAPRRSTKKLAAPKVQPKPSSGKKTIATAPKKPGPAPVTPVRAASKPAPACPSPRERRSGGSVLSGPVKGFTPYQPKRGEEYMNKDQLEHFRQLLLAWKRELMEEVDRTMLHMKDDAANFPDPNDRATQESEFGLELRTRDRERKLLEKDRLGARAHRRRQLRLLRRDRRRDRLAPPRGAARCHAVRRGAGAARARRAPVPRSRGSVPLSAPAER